MRTNGKGKRRTWRKVHVAIDREKQEIASISLTESNVHDSQETESLLSRLGNVATEKRDKGYDNKNANAPIAAKGARAIIPVRSGAALKKKNISWGDVKRNRIVKEAHRNGKDAWKHGSGYTKRVSVETGIGRYQQTIGPRLHSKKLCNQKRRSESGQRSSIR